MSSTLRIVPLGGLGEIGLNCMAIESDDSIVVVDCGVLFPDHMPGLDVIIPDFSYLRENRRKVRGVVITHGHEDHIGAVPYLQRELKVPVYGPRYALALMKERANEVADCPDLDLNPTHAGKPFRVGSIDVEPIRVTHSIADATALALSCDGTRIIHTGDFKIDEAPLDGDPIDLARFRALGDEGVDVLLSDSTNSDVQGSSGSEENVALALEGVISKARTRVVVSLFASNVHRMQALFRIAKKLGRKVCLLGRSMHTHSRIAMDERYMEDFSDVLVPAEEAQELPRESLLILATGSQGEPLAALSKLSKDTHPHVHLAPGDLVVLSSRVIPGHEREVASIIDDLERRQLDVRTHADERDLHVTGHAYQDEQQRMIELVRPRNFVPVHGGYRQLARHARLAQSLGIKSAQPFENGAILEVSHGELRFAGQTQAGRVHIEDGFPVDEATVLDARREMFEHGLAVVMVTMDKRAKLAELPFVFSYGAIEDETLLDECAHDIERAIDDLTKRKRVDDDAHLEEVAKKATRRFFRKYHRRPSVHCIVQWLD